MSLLADFWEYCSCYEVPRNYALWGGLGLLSATVNRKVFIRQGDIRHSCTMFITLVGEQGGRKSTPKDFARNWFTSAFPDAPLAAAMQSREDIIKYLASEEAIRSYKDHEGAIVEYHPYAFFINELKNFLSFNPAGMIEFLTDIFDRDYFDSRTIKRGLEPIINPALTILACECPDWIIDKLKSSIITGGFARRMIYVYEIEDIEFLVNNAKPRPAIPASARLAEERIISHLKRIANASGEYRFTPEAATFFDQWYIDNLRTLPTDRVMRGYRRTKDVQLLKTAMLIGMSKPDINFKLTPELLEEGLAMLDAIEVNMPKLSLAAGRNPLAVPQQRIIDWINQRGGRANEKEVMREMGKDLAPMEVLSVLRYLKDSDQLFEDKEPIKGTNPVRFRPFVITRQGIMKKH